MIYVWYVGIWIIKCGLVTMARSAICSSGFSDNDLWFSVYGFLVSLTILRSLSAAYRIYSRFLFCFSFSLCQAGRFFVLSGDLTSGIGGHFLNFPAIIKLFFKYMIGKYVFPSCSFHRFPLLLMMLKGAISFISDVRIISLVLLFILSMICPNN